MENNHSQGNKNKDNTNSHKLESKNTPKKSSSNDILHLQFSQEMNDEEYQEINDKKRKQPGAQNINNQQFYDDMDEDLENFMFDSDDEDLIQIEDEDDIIFQQIQEIQNQKKARNQNKTNHEDKQVDKIKTQNTISEKDQNLLSQFFASTQTSNNINQDNNQSMFNKNPFKRQGTSENERVKIDEFKLIETNVPFSTQNSLQQNQLNQQQQKDKRDLEFIMESGLFNMLVNKMQDDQMNQQEEKVKLGSSTLSKFSEDIKLNYNDGKRIYVNRLVYYPDSAIQEHMLSFKQLMYKDLGMNNKLKGKSGIQRAIMTSMVIQIDLCQQLLDERIPLTLFLDRHKDDKGPQVEYNDKHNFNVVYQQKWGSMNYGVFHPKLILYEYDDRLRVIVSSANIYFPDWEDLSQVIWFQDFFKAELGASKQKQQENINAQPQEEEEKMSDSIGRQQTMSDIDNDFKKYLKDFLELLTPKNVKVREIYRQKIDLDKYNFSKANAFLVGSLNGRFTDSNFYKYGQNRLGLIAGKSQSEKTITYQTSSLGKLNPKFLHSLYKQFDKNSKKTQNDIEKNFRIIFPTKGYVSTSFLGERGASSIILQEQYWSSVGFPRKSFCRQEGKSKALDLNLYHAKFIIITEKGKESEITDDTCLYFGSHNFSGGAWGNLEKGDSQIAIANWELGIMFGPQKGSKQMKQKMIDNMVLKYPPEKYSEKDTPFCF